MVRRKESERVVTHETRWDVHWDRLMWSVFKFILLFIIVAQVFGLFSDAVREDQHIYRECTWACEKKCYSGTKTGLDIDQGAYLVIEADRTECVKACNDLYLAMQEGS